jgi:hypothetical protein
MGVDRPRRIVRRVHGDLTHTFQKEDRHVERQRQEAKGGQVQAEDRRLALQGGAGQPVGQETGAVVRSGAKRGYSR